MYRKESVKTEQTHNERVKGETHPAFKERSENKDFVGTGLKRNTLLEGSPPLADDAWRDEACCFHHLKVSVVETGASPSFASNKDDLHVHRALGSTSFFFLAFLVRPPAFFGAIRIQEQCGKVKGRARGLKNLVMGKMEGTCRMLAVADK